MDDHLLERIRRFHNDFFPDYKDKFKALVDQGQHPTILFVGCSDSRLVPYMLTGTGPGELFIVRNVGALVPPYNGLHGLHGTAAAIEYAVLNLHVSHIIVCGHYHCGAMHGLLRYEQLDLPAVRKWFYHAEATRRIMKERAGQVAPEALERMAVEQNVLVQIDNLRTHPCVAAGLARGELELFAWVYKIETGDVFAYDPGQRGYVSLTEPLPKPLTAMSSPRPTTWWTSAPRQAPAVVNLSRPVRLSRWLR